MIRSLLAFTLTVAAAVGAAPVDAAAQPGAAARTRDIFVSVLDRKDTPVAGLRADDFVVREDGVAREVLKAEPATAPMQIVLVVDDSAAADTWIRDLREGLNAFVTAMEGRAEIGLVTVGERPTSIVELTKDSAAVRKGISRIFARQGSGAYFLEGLSEVARGFRKREAERPVIVALITEGVEFSNLSAPPLLEELQASGATLHVLSLGRPSDLLSDEIRTRNIVIAEGTSRTGGRREQVLVSSAVPGELRRLADELLNQYVVTYGTPDALIPPEKIEVSTKRKDLTVRARTRVHAK